MTKEQIEAARKTIVGKIPVATWTHEALDALDDLCEAARQPQSLVGRRVRIKVGPWSNNRELKVQGQYARMFYEIGFDGYVNPKETLVRDDFELLEDTEAERRLKIMRAVCEAAADNWDTLTFEPEIEAFRQMEDEREKT